LPAMRTARGNCRARPAAGHAFLGRSAVGAVHDAGAPAFTRALLLAPRTTVAPAGSLSRDPYHHATGTAQLGGSIRWNGANWVSDT